MKHVLITGATGALGSALVPLFAADPATHITLLLRADSPEHLEDRRKALLDFLRSGNSETEFDASLDAVRGDASSTHLGLAPQTAIALTQTITHVVHAAGNVKLNQSIEDARGTALGSAQAIVDFVRRCQESGPFEKLEFISTVGVAGRRAGIIPEERADGNREVTEFHNTYEAAKWEAEKYLWEQIDNGLPATIHRPSMIVGDSATGRIIRFQVFYYLMDFLLGRRTWGLVPRTGDATLDIIPVDYVARAIVLASQDQSTVGQVWHLCSGPKSSWQLAELISATRELLAARGEPIPETRPLSPDVFRDVLQAMCPFMPAPSQPFLRGLPYLVEYLDERQAFSTVRTNSFLRSKNLEVPAVDTYLGTVMNAYWDRTSHSPHTR